MTAVGVRSVDTELTHLVDVKIHVLVPENMYKQKVKATMTEMF
jgi:hypothetical protein